MQRQGTPKDTIQPRHRDRLSKFPGKALALSDPLPYLARQNGKAATDEILLTINVRPLDGPWPHRQKLFFRVFDAADFKIII